MFSSVDTSLKSRNGLQAWKFWLSLTCWIVYTVVKPTKLCWLLKAFYAALEHKRKFFFFSARLTAIWWFKDMKTNAIFGFGFCAHFRKLRAPLNPTGFWTGRLISQAKKTNLLQFQQAFFTRKTQSPFPEGIKIKYNFVYFEKTGFGNSLKLDARPEKFFQKRKRNIKKTFKGVLTPN